MIFRCSEAPAHVVSDVRNFILFKSMLRIMKEGRSVVKIPEEDFFANYLRFSRQHLVEGGSFSFHRVGTHRRVVFRDLLAYEQSRDANRREKTISLM